MDELKSQKKLEAGGLLYKNSLAMIGLMGIPSRPGFGGEYIKKLGQSDVNVELISNVSDFEKVDHIVICVHRHQLDTALKISRQIKDAVNAESLVYDENVALVSIFSPDVKESQKLAGHMFKALGDNNINIHGICTSFSLITCLIESEDLESALAALRNAFLLP